MATSLSVSDRRCTSSRPFFAALGIVFALAAAFLLPTAVQAQDTGSISGVVVDGETGETLPGANVLVKGTQNGTSTDIDGRYRITGLAPGTYDMEYSFVSYQSKTVTSVEVSAGKTATLDVTLNAETAQMDEVVVTAEVARNSEAGLLRQRQKAASVSDAISAEAISESGSSNAADAMEKVTGVAVTDGRYVNVRGLGGRYVNTTLNGAELPSADPERSSVPFDLFPSNLLQSIVTSKTFTPDRAGSFTGGSVDIGTVAFPSEFTLTASSSVGYNTAAGFGQDRYGFVGGLSGIPSVVDGGIPNRFQARDPNSEEGARLNSVMNAFSGSGIAPEVNSVPLEQSYELAFGSDFEVFSGRELGVVASFSYDQNVNGYSGGTTGRYLVASRENDVLSPDLNLQDEQTTVEDLYSGLVNLALRPAAGHEVGLNLMYTQSNEREGRFQQGFNDNLTSSGGQLQTRVLRRTERYVANAQARGEHTFAAGLLEGLYGEDVGGLTATWNASYSRTQQDEPDYRFFFNEFFPDAETAEQRYGFNQGDAGEAPTRYFRNLEEEGLSGDASVEVPVFNAMTFKVGGSYSNQSRSFRQRLFNYNLNPIIQYQGDPGDFLGAKAGFVDLDGDGTMEVGNILQEQTRGADNYDGDRVIGAGFAMVDVQMGRLIDRLGADRIPVLSALRLIGGARVEQTDLQVLSLSGDADNNGQINRTDVLPSLNLVYSVSDAMNVRAAYGRTLARPTFKEFAPVTFQEFIGAFDEQGNPDLNRTLIDNFDLRWEWFPNAGEILALSGFYKNFDGAIERTFNSNQVNPVITYFNSDEAIVYGVEVEARKNLGFVAGALRSFSAGANLTLAQSEARDEQLDQAETGSTTRRFQGQSNYLVNANLSYENVGIGTTASLYYNVFGERLDAIVRDAGGPPIFEQPRNSLDLTVSQRFAPLGLNNVKLRMKARNLLGAEFRVTRSYADETRLFRGYELGRTFTVGLQYDF